ncbi:uncharacterized protein N7511_006225 [Penicillium nucicola]|uniref:uncharacterized protein n=1 Tax=Penicillium nucicola TaxID=1850975 RepID=UPI0025458A0A|nr:uncharacterized protein N7511_006225 [Penicillium nucicola]KAJ5757531.1 hypothetical protein N7511_006225 [Penicillium nucicola]
MTAGSALTGFWLWLALALASGSGFGFWLWTLVSHWSTDPHFQPFQGFPAPASAALMRDLRTKIARIQTVGSA